MMQIKLEEKICEGQAYYQAKNSDLKLSILTEKGFYGL